MAANERTAPGPVPIFLSKSAQAHKAAVQYYNDQIRQKVKAKQFTSDNAPYAAANTAPDDLMTLANRHGVGFGGNAPAEQGLHSGSGAVDPFNRPAPTTTARPPVPSVDASGVSALMAGSLASMNPASGAAAAALASSAARTAPDGRPLSPVMTQLIGTPLPADVAQTVLAQNRAASQPSATPDFLGASSRYVSNGNFNTQQALNDYVKGNLTRGQLSAVYDDASGASNRQGAGISPATQAEMRGTAGVAQQLQASQDARAAADAASRRQPGGSPYGMVPVDPSQQGNTYVGDGRMTFNGQVLPAGQTLTLLPGGRKIYGQAPAAQTTAQTSNPANALGDYATPQAVAASDKVAQALQNADFSRESATGPIAQAAQAKIAGGPAVPATANGLVVPEMAPPAAPSPSPPAYPERPTPPVPPAPQYTLEQQFKDLQAGGTGAPPAPPAPTAYPAPKVYDRNDPSSLPDATTNAQMAYIRNAGQPDPVNPVAAIRTTPGAPPNSLLASANTPVGGASDNGFGPTSLTLAGTSQPSTAADGNAFASHLARAAALPATPFITGASQALARPGTTISSTGGPISDAAIALDRSTDASQNLARPGQQTDTGGPVSDAAGRLNRRTDADLALNPAAPSTSVTPDTGNGLLNSYVSSTPGAPARGQSLDGATPFNLQGTATNNGATSFSGALASLVPAPPTTDFGQSPPFPGIGGTGGGNPSFNLQSTAPSADSDPFGTSTPRTTAANPNAGAGTPDNGTPLGDDEEMVNGVRRKKLQSSTSPAAPAPTSAGSNNSAPAAPGGSGGSGGSDS